MSPESSQYTCDECKRRKIRCTRGLPRCLQCQEASRSCVYSRSGVVHRKKRGRASVPVGKSPLTPLSIDKTAPSASPDPSREDTSRHQSISKNNVERTINETKLLLDTTTIASTTGDDDPFWQDPAFVDMAERIRIQNSQLFTFEDEAKSWAEICSAMLEKGSPVLTPQSPELLERIAREPEQISDKAYLVMYYGIVLTQISMDPKYDERIKKKLRWNLWQCMNDARFLLEPRDINIQAILMLACHVQDFHTPSLCWMLVTSACRMLQYLTINNRSMTDEVRMRRMILFWTLDDIDKSLALVFGRPPAFHSSHYDLLPPPTVRELTAYSPHAPSTCGIPGLFGAHFLHRMFLCSRVMADVWHCLYENDTPVQKQKIRAEASQWYEETRKVLEAALIAERTLHGATAEKSMRLALQLVKFRGLYLAVLLTRSHDQPTDECIDISRQCMQLLPHLIADSREVYSGIIWQTLLQPFTPFFCLMEHARCNDLPQQARLQSADAMASLVQFLNDMRPRHPLAARLHTFAANHLLNARLAASISPDGPRPWQIHPGEACERAAVSKPPPVSVNQPPVVEAGTNMDFLFSLEPNWMNGLP